MSSTQAVLRIERQGPVVHVVLCNPEKRNAMGPSFKDELRAAFGGLDREPGVRAVILRAEGKSFCSGLDLMALAGYDPAIMNIPNPAHVKPRVLALIRDFQDGLNAVERCRKPVIAAIHGHCIGGGLDLVAACDVRLASADAVFSLREARVGILADLGSLQRLPGIIGEGWTRQLAFTAEDIGAAKAREIGLINDFYPTPEELLKAADEMAERIASNAPLAVQSGKEVLNWGRGRPLADALEYVAVRNQAIFPGEDILEAMAAFMERRAPNYKD